MSDSALPRIVVRLLRLIVPSRTAATVIADLDDEYRRVRQHRASVSAAGWLTRETASLVRAYGAAAVRARVGITPIFVRDIVLVWRSLRSRPLATFGAAAMLATGIAAVLVTLALSAALLFRPVSAIHGERLRRIAAIDKDGRTILRVSYPELEIVRGQLGETARLAAVNLQPVVARVDDTSVQTMAEVVDGEFLALAGINMVIGRGLMTADDRAAADRVAVISQPFWRDRFESSSAALGQVIFLNGTAYTVVGVANVLGSTSSVGASVDVWVPVAHGDAVLNRGWRTNVADRWFTAYALPARSVAEIDGHLAAAAAELARRYPDAWRDRRMQTLPGTVVVGSQRRTAVTLAVILSAFATLILAVAAANVSGLLLARVAAETRATAIHLSLGSGRYAAARRLVLEGAALGLIASAVATLAYAWLRSWFASIAVLPTLGLRLDLAPASAVAFNACIGTVLAGAALAIGPAVWAMRIDTAAALAASGTRLTGGRRLARTRRVLVAIQVALSLALVAGAALFGRSLDALLNVDTGFDRSRLVAMDFDVEPSSLPASELSAIGREAFARVATVAGISSLAMSNRAPVDQSTPAIEVRANNDAPVVGDVTMYLATPGYFDTIGLPLVAGRSFSQMEADQDADVVIVNESLAAQLFPRGDAIDRVITLVATATRARVIGVARDSKYRTLTESKRPHLYRPTSPRLGLTLLARTSGDPYEALRVIQQTLDGVGPGLVGFFPRTLTDHVEIELLPTRAAAAAARWLGLLSLVLAAVGLYGVVAWFVELRHAEIGVRMALGASPRDVRTLVVRQALNAALPGLVMGLMVAIALATLARSALFGVSPLDGIALTAAVVALMLVVLAASYLPTRRATRIDPSTVLRS